MFKKLMAMMLAPMMCVGMGSITAFAAEATSGVLHDGEMLKIYNIPACYDEYTGLSLKINGVTAPITKYPSSGADYNYVNFSFGGSATMEITAPEEITHYSVSPLAFEIEGTLSADKRTVTFSIDQPRYLIVEINNYPRLVIGADALESDVPKTTDENVFLLTDYLTDANGGAGASAENPTGGLQAAIDAAHAVGTAQKPGIVYVPAGVYYVPNVLLRSNVHLYMAPSAVIRGTANRSDYEKHWRKNSVGKDGTMFISNEPDADNVKIYGRGILDGNGHLMRQRGFLNSTFSTQNISNLTIDGVTFTDAGLWMVMINRANDVNITNTKFYNDRSDTENDGLDINESQNVVVRHCISISEDDTYSTKTWERDTDLCVSWEGDPEELSNVLFEDCVGWSKCCTFKVGSGAWQPQRDITFRNCYAYRTMAGLKIEVLYAQKGRYTPIENVTFENIDIEGYEPHDTDNHNTRWLEFEIGNQCDTTPVNNTVVKNITVRDLGDQWRNTASMLKGMNTTSSFNGVTFENISIPDGNGGFKYASSLEDMNINTSSPAFYTPSYVNDVVILPESEEGEGTQDGTERPVLIDDPMSAETVQNSPVHLERTDNIVWDAFAGSDGGAKRIDNAEQAYIIWEVDDDAKRVEYLLNYNVLRIGDTQPELMVYTSADKENWSAQAMEVIGEATNVSANNDNQWNSKTYSSAEDLPEGTKYVKLAFPVISGNDIREWALFLEHFTVYGALDEDSGVTTPDPTPNGGNDQTAPETDNEDPSLDAAKPNDGAPIGAILAVAGVLAAAALATVGIIIKKRRKKND